MFVYYCIITNRLMILLCILYLHLNNIIQLLVETDREPPARYYIDILGALVLRWPCLMALLTTFCLHFFLQRFQGIPIKFNQHTLVGSRVAMYEYIELRLYCQKSLVSILLLPIITFYSTLHTSYLFHCAIQKMEHTAVQRRRVYLACRAIFTGQNER